MDTIQQNCEGLDPLKTVGRLGEELQCFFAEYLKIYDELQRKDEQIRELKQQMETMRNDPWSSRVTYENVVEQIASNEDAHGRDEARKVIEPLLKKEQVRQLRRDIKRKVKELEAADGIENARTFNNYGTYNEVQAGGTNIINNRQDGGD